MGVFSDYLHVNKEEGLLDGSGKPSSYTCFFLFYILIKLAIDIYVYIFFLEEIYI